MAKKMSEYLTTEDMKADQKPKKNKDTFYTAYKLGRRTDSHNKGPAAVKDGEIFGANAKCKALVYDFKKKKAVKQKTFVPKIGQCVWIEDAEGGMFDYVRTSLIEDFYIHGDYENSKDKIVLKPENAFLLGALDFKDGDVLLVTMNSLYFLKVQE